LGKKQLKGSDKTLYEKKRLKTLNNNYFKTKRVVENRANRWRGEDLVPPEQQPNIL
jgi:hypothetical protein